MKNRFLTGLMGLLAVAVLVTGPVLASSVDGVFPCFSAATATSACAAAGGYVSTFGASSVSVDIFAASTSTSTILVQVSSDKTNWVTLETISNQGSTHYTKFIPVWPYTKLNLSARSAGTLTGNVIVSKVPVDPASLGLRSITATPGTDMSSPTITTPTLSGAITLSGSPAWKGTATAKALTESSATIFATVTVPSGGRIGGFVEYTIDADDATDFQARSGVLPFSAVNKAGTITCTVGTVSAATEVVAVSTGTLTNTFTCADATGNVMNLLANSVSSLTQTTLEIRPVVHVFGSATVTYP